MLLNRISFTSEKRPKLSMWWYSKFCITDIETHSDKLSREQKDAYKTFSIMDLNSEPSVSQADALPVCHGVDVYMSHGLRKIDNYRTCVTSCLILLKQLPMHGTGTEPRFDKNKGRKRPKMVKSLIQN